MKNKKENQTAIFPVTVTGKRPTLCGRSIAGIKFPAEYVSLLETKKQQPSFSAIQFWVAEKKVWLFRKRRFLMAKFFSDGSSKSMYVKNAWLKAEALSYISSYWDKDIPK